MNIRRVLLLPLAATVLAAPQAVLAQYGSAGQSGTSGSSAPMPSSTTPSAKPSSESHGATAMSTSTTFTITSVDKNANTIKVNFSGSDFSQFKQGQQISVVADTATPDPGRSEQTPSRGNEPYGQAKKGISATIVSMDQSAKTLTLRLTGADWTTLQTGSRLNMNHVTQQSNTSSPNRSNETQGLSEPGNSPSTPAQPNSAQPNSDRPSDEN